jgi:hypothetical protein
LTSAAALAVNFKDHQYLRADDDDPRYLAPARAIATGLLRDPFVDQHNRRLVADDLRDAMSRAAMPTFGRPLQVGNGIARCDESRCDADLRSAATE